MYFVRQEILYHHAVVIKEWRVGAWDIPNVSDFFFMTSWNAGTDVSI
jgi:hypothetical protein